VGGKGDNSSLGAAWVFTRNGTTWSQQGDKLVGTGAVGAAQQGRAISLSADGTTAILGGWADNSSQGAAWIFTRSGTTWTQQGTKLVGTGSVAVQQGYAVSLSADGNTAIVGGNGGRPDSFQGAAWIFTRSGTTWNQQGEKIIGTGNIGGAAQGAVSLSANGTTAIVGGGSDNSSQGAAWIYAYVPPPTITSFSPSSGPVGTLVTITGTNLGTPTAFTIGGTAAIVISNTGTSLVGMVMPGVVSGTISLTTASGSVTSTGTFTLSAAPAPSTQQGSKLVGTGISGSPTLGYSVSLSADGTTAIVGGYADDSNQGAAWIYTRSGDTWTQQGAKLIGTGNTGPANQGIGVSLSADGNTAIVGGYADNSNQGAAWIFIRSGTTWSQQGSKLVGTGNTGAAGQGTAISLSADGTTAIVGGNLDDTNKGAAWMYTYAPPPTITSATYNALTGLLEVTGVNLAATAGATNDIDVTKLTFTGQGGSTFTLTSNTTNVEITNGTSFTVSLGASDKTSVNSLLNKNGTSSIGGTTYNLAAAEDWNAGADPAVVIADLTGNGIAVSNVATITTTGTLTALTTIYATASSNTSFSVSGASLTNDIIVTAPTGFEVSVSTTSGFGNTVTLTQTSGTVSITTVYVRLKSNSTVAGSPYSGDVTCTSTNAQTVNVATVSSTVTAQALTIGGVTANNKEYDANTTATLGGTATLVGVATADQANVTLAGTATATFNNASVGTSKAVTVTGYTLGGTAAGNYTVSQPSGLTANITAKGLTITGVTANNKEYDANTTATLSGTPTLVGVATADQANVTLAGTATATFNNASVGTSKAVSVSGYTLGGTAAGNYTVSQPTGVTANISAKAASTLSIDPIANQNFTRAAITPTVNVKDGATTLTLGTDYSVAYSNNTNVGTATVTVTGMGVYTGTKTQNFAIVSKAVGTLTIDPITNQIYTGAAINPSAVVKDGSTTLILGTDYSVACSNNTNVGTAILTITGIGNYTGTKNEAFTIVAKSVNTLSIGTIINQTYTGAAINPSTIVKDGNITLILGTDYSVACSNNTNVGTAILTITGIGNYTSTKDENFNILPKELTIQANNAFKIYGDANPSLSFSYRGLVAGDTEIDQVPTISTATSTTSGVGTYPITLTGGSDPNYSLTLVEGVLEVSLAPLSLAVNNASKIYGQADPVFTYSLQGLKGSDTEAVLAGAFTRETGQDPGTYRINQGSLSAGANYNLTVTGASLQILKAKVSSIAQLPLLTTAWSKEPALPATVKVLAAHGQDFQVEVKWDKSTLNLLARGTYSLTGTLLLPAGIENPNQVLAKIQVQVLPKPAPRDVTITNNTFVGSTTQFFISVGDFLVNDPVDNIHVVSLLGDGYDNTYFEIKNNILFWSSAERAAGKTTFSIVVRVTDRDGNTLDKFFEIKRTRPDFSTVTIFNTFTPNADRFNDTWGAPELRFYEGVRISVYDRGGSRLFYTENPDIRWDGTFEGKELPIGSYYWVIQIDETGLTRRGMVNLIRE
jgi:gliding motility-associated-like protein